MNNQTDQKGYIGPVKLAFLPSPPKNGSRTVSYEGYVHEILDHAGLWYETVPAADLAKQLPSTRVLLTIGESAPDDTFKSALREWVEQGGAWIGIGGVCGLGDLFGVEPEPPAYSSWGGGLGNLGEGYLERVVEHPVMGQPRIPMHFFNGLPVKAAGGQVLGRVLDAHGRPTERAGVVENRVGKGLCLFIAADLTGTVVRIQQGIGAVTRDGVSAPDGTGPVGDCVLKSGDGCALDWLLDREPVEATPGLQIFRQATADQWRDLLLRAVFHAASVSGLSVPLLWYHPRNADAVACMSHDSDGNDEECARELMRVVGECGINTTWCILSPGYKPETIAKIAAAGHELAMHYDSMSEGRPWGDAQFQTQWEQLVELFRSRPLSNKNHYLRWEGDCDQLQMCAKRGIELDQSRGAAKTGEAGFNFGTSHLYFSVLFDGTKVDVLEMITTTQDLDHFAPVEIAEPLLETVLAHYGVYHLLFHPAHITKPKVAAAIYRTVKMAKDAGLEWWTAGRINTWERARRRAEWTGGEGGGAVLSVQDNMPGATVLWLKAGDVDAAPSVNGTESAAGEATRWGFRFAMAVADAAAGQPIAIAPRKA